MLSNWSSVRHIPYGEINKIGIDEYVIGRSELGIVLKEEGTDGLFHVPRGFPGFLLRGLSLSLDGILPHPGVFWTEEFFGDGKFARLLGAAHLPQTSVEETKNGAANGHAGGCVFVLVVARFASESAVTKSDAVEQLQ
jgi:hypothetical protein